ncbi:MAG: hypothetical protein RML36_01310 [Anaerolineae bacterium]|nr:hypothetical protein [Anaerolineae bacterium]MDW8098107.1 hypothetical protein [Anaerolineae bacterium]
MFKFSRPFTALVGAFAAGLLIGWLVIGWWIWPVTWTNALPVDLSPEYRRTYVVGIAYTFQATGDLERARREMEALGGGIEQRRALEEALAVASAADRDALVELERALQLPLLPRSARSLESDSSWVPLLLGVLLGLFLIGLGTVAFHLVKTGEISVRLPMRARILGSSLPAGTALSKHDVLVEENRLQEAEKLFTEERELRLREKLGSFTPTFRRGIREYTENFDLAAPDGSAYEGDCGMGVSETLEGDDDRVTALEVWLFDKSDIRTQTYVLASEYAYSDPMLRKRLSTHGPEVPARPGETFTIEGKSLVLVGKVLSVTYANAEERPQSVFEEVQVSLEVYRKG